VACEKGKTYLEEGLLFEETLRKLVTLEGSGVCV
jgi:hypothetical protein